MRLYKYLPPERADVLIRARLRFTQPLFFNDPFELSPTIRALIAASDEDQFVESALASDEFAQRFHEACEERLRVVPPELRPTRNALNAALTLEEPKVRALMQQLLGEVGPYLSARWLPETRERVGRQVGVLSLAEIPDSLLMWAHYAESHRGFVVGFDGGHPFFDQRKYPGDVIRRLQRVHYSSERPAAALLNPSLSEQEQADLLASHFWLTKSRDWEYEKEWRMLCSKDDASEVLRIGDQDVCLYSVPESAMTDVVLGCQMTAVDRARLLELRSEQRYAHITWSAACVDANHFRINIRPI